MQRHLTALLLVSLLAACGGGGSSEDAPAAAGATGTTAFRDMNIIVVFTDDQRWDTVSAMPNLMERVAARGMTFDNAYITTPLCAPARASVLSGGHYIHDTRVLTNEPVNGNWQNFTDSDTLVKQLRTGQLITGFVGKYINGFNVRRADMDAAELPDGWDYFYADDYRGYPRTGYFDSSYLEAADFLPAPGWRSGTTRENLTNRQTRKAIEFVERHAREQFFLFLSYRAPHDPFTDSNQLPEDQLAFQDVLYRDRAWGEADMSDKSLATRRAADDDYLGTEEADLAPPGQMRLLQPVDRGIGQLLDTLEAQGIDDNTAIIFLSDNGYHWGEHRLFGKGSPYEESVRTPLIMYVPGLDGGRRDALVAANLDVPATVLDMAGVPPGGSGSSLLPLMLSGDRTDSQIYLENFSRGFGNAYIWSGVIRRSAGRSLKLVDFNNGDSEFYDLEADPFELENIYPEVAADPEVQEMRADLEAFKRIAILDRLLPEGRAAQPYDYQLSWWGEETVPDFRLVKGDLPVGVTLSSDGRLSGLPAVAGNYFVQIQATGAEVSRLDGQPLSYTAQFILTIQE